MMDLEFLGQVEQALPRALHGSGSLSVAARHLACGPGAKRARPLLCLRVANLVTIEPQVLVDIAVAVELMHSASLLHDDIIDGGETRRGKPTVNALNGNTTAVLTGDLVLSRALTLLGRYQLTERAVSVVEEMTLALFAEVSARRGAALSLEAWRTMAEGKSGALFGLSGALVAQRAGDLGLARQLDVMGRHLGVAFQVADDIDDLEGDLREGNPSLPLLLQRNGLSLAEALGRSRATIEREVEAARAALGPVATHPALSEVWAWAETLTSRSAP